MFSAKDVLPIKTVGGPVGLPKVGLGLWKLDKDKCSDTVYTAIKLGYRGLDSACDYGNEIEVGAGLAKALEEKICTREEIFVTSKLWNTFHRKEHVREGLEKTLKDLQLSYLDLYLIHFPTVSLKYVPIGTRYPPEWVFDPSAAKPQMELDAVPIQETWAVLEELVAEGKIKAIGLCNVGMSVLGDVMAYAKVPVSVLQIELHPHLTQERLVRYAQKNGVAVTGFSPLGSGSYVQIGMATEADSVLKSPVVNAIAAAKNRTAAQVVLRWGIQRDTAIIPKSSSVERLKENGSLFDFELSSEEMTAISALNCGKRLNDPGMFCLGMGADVPIYQ